MSNLLIFIGLIVLLIGSLFAYRYFEEARYVPTIGRSLSAEIRE